LGYVKTIHKSQGTEKDIVYILMAECQLNTKNLIYTAISRAKKKCIIVGNETMIKNALSRMQPKRYTNLQKFIQFH